MADLSWISALTNQGGGGGSSGGVSDYDQLKNRPVIHFRSFWANHTELPQRHLTEVQNAIGIIRTLILFEDIQHIDIRRHSPAKTTQMCL